MKYDFYDAIAKRRSRYSIENKSPVSDKRITEVIEYALNNAPTAFNCQGSRIVLLFGKSHTKLWDITKEALRAIIPADKFEPTEQKIESFSSGYGSLLYFEDNSTVTSLQTQFPAYKGKFPVWAEQANGMLQYIIWTSLIVEGLGASLQHYNPLIDEAVHKEFDLPSQWTLIAQMPFGKPFADPAEKECLPIDSRLKVFN